MVRGGWEGHSPVEATDLFIPFLRENGYEVTVSDTTESYLNLDGVDLVLQCVTMSEIPAEHVKGLDAAIRNGTGLAGWHGGIADSFRNSADYNFIVGGQFISHPHGFTDYRVDVVAEHPIVEGITPLRRPHRAVLHPLRPDGHRARDHDVRSRTRTTRGSRAR